MFKMYLRVIFLAPPPLLLRSCTLFTHRFVSALFLTKSLYTNKQILCLFVRFLRTTGKYYVWKAHPVRLCFSSHSGGAEAFRAHAGLQVSQAKPRHVCVRSRQTGLSGRGEVGLISAPRLGFINIFRSHKCDMIFFLIFI